MPRLHPELLPTALVLTMAAFVIGALAAPPDPFTQLLFLAPGVLAALALAALLTYGGVFDRLGWSPGTLDHVWTGAVFLGVAVGGGVLAPDPTGPLATLVGPLVGLLVGAWVGWGGGRGRLSDR